jgi:hypothetical protein
MVRRGLNKLATLTLDGNRRLLKSQTMKSFITIAIIVFLEASFAQDLRRQTPMSRQWIANRLRMGVPAMFQICSAVWIATSDPFFLSRQNS